MPFKPSHADPELMIDINTTPLIDVMLVLLIMLIITIPVQLQAVNLKLPTPAAKTQEPPQVFKLEISAEGTVRWNGELLTDAAALEEKLTAAAQLTTAPELQLRVSSQAPYRHVAAVLAAAQRHGLHRLGIVSSSNQ